MTVSTSGGSTAVGAYVPDNQGYGDVGLEDVGVEDVIIPRLKLKHAEGLFEDNLSKASWPKIEVVLLGLVKQRIYWANEMEDGDKPLCKSPDFDHGFPNMLTTVNLDKRFPWAESNFDISAAQPVEEDPTKMYPEGYSSNGHGTLPCGSCKFQQWGNKPGGGSVPPPCAEQHVYPLMYRPDPEQDEWITAILTLQKTGIKPSKQYISSFVQTKTPMFAVKTFISLTTLSRGSVKYSVPIFSRGENTDKNSWPEYANTLRTVRSFIRSAPRLNEDAESAPAAPTPNVNTAPAPAQKAAPAPVAVPTPKAAPVAAPAPVVAAPAPTPAPVDTPAMAAPVEDDDLPF